MMIRRELNKLISEERRLEECETKLGFLIRELPEHKSALGVIQQNVKANLKKISEKVEKECPHSRKSDYHDHLFCDDCGHSL